MRTGKLVLFTFISFFLFLTTCKEIKKEMLVTTGTVSNILISTADVSGTVLDLGDGATQHGHCYATTANANVSGTKTELGAPPLGGFTSALTGLSPGTKYYIKAYLSRGKDVVYGDEITFTTASDQLPEVTTADITGISKTGAVSGGNVTDEGGTPVTARGVCWSTATNPAVDGNKTTNGSGTGSFSSTITSLTAGTKYYVKAYATNSGGTAYGNELTFTTTPDAPTLPTVITAAVTSVTVSTAISGGEVTNEGGATVTARGVCWSTSINPDINGNKTIDGDGQGSFISNLSGLTGNTTYYVRAYAINSVGPAYGNELSFKTGAVLPSITTSAVTTITSTSAVGGGDISSDGGSEVITRGICWGTSQNPTVDGSHTSNGSGTGNFISSITDLSPGVTYYVRAYAINSIGTEYGNELSFQTESEGPVITTAAVTSVTSTTATSGGNITSDGGSPVVGRGVCWSTSPNPTILNSKTEDGAGLGIFSSSLTGLLPGTLYYVRAYATNNVETAYGNEISFNTDAVLPTLATTGITLITQSTASSGGSISNDGGSMVTARGVCWATSLNPTIANANTNNGLGIGSFTSSITGLTSNTLYHVRAYATNSVGTNYGNDYEFTSLAIVSTAAVSNISVTMVMGGGTVDVGGGADITSKGLCWSTSPDPTTANSKINAGPGTGTFLSSITGLISNTTYYIRAYAINAGGTSYGEQRTFTTLASLSTSSITNITSGTASSGGTVDLGGGAIVFSRGVCWSTNQDPTTDNSKTTDASGTGSYVSNISGLSSNTIYYVRAYATNEGGTSYGNQETFTSLASLSTSTISNISANSASGGGNITIGGGAPITARGVCWNTSSNPTVANNKTTNGSGTGGYTSTLIGLNRLTNYYVRAYATNAGGTAYGNQISFTTTRCPTSVSHFVSAGDVAPVLKSVTYEVIESNLSGANKCWITKNLGATNQASSATDATEAAAGWYWQFNRKQGYKNDGLIRTPATSWIHPITENSNWAAANDPCTILLGTGWRIPTSTEWTNVNSNGGWTTYNDSYSSVLKLHGAGSLFYDTGVLGSVGYIGFYWSNVQYSNTSYGYYLNTSFSSSGISSNYKSRGGSIRCIQD